jgi:hypothetical protein
MSLPNLSPPPIQEGPEGKGKFSAAWIRWFSQLQGFLAAVAASGGGGGGGVTSVSFVNANGFTGAVSTPTTTPAITINSGPGSVSSVGATVPLQSSGGNTPVISFTGILPVANGGSGSASPSLVAGANITVSGAWPNQQIDASGGGGGVTIGYVLATQILQGVL